MEVLGAGAHGQVGQHVTERLAEDDHEVRGMVRDESQESDIEDLGAEPVLADLTEDVTHAVEGCAAVVFAPGSVGRREGSLLGSDGKYRGEFLPVRLIRFTAETEGEGRREVASTGT